MNVAISETSAIDLPELKQLAMDAFGLEEGPEIALLIERLLVDATAQPGLSLKAQVKDAIVGHVLLTRARILPDFEKMQASILAPLMVHPDYQSQGIGSKLVYAALEKVKQQGNTLVFVLGDPNYYTRFNFAPAGKQNLHAPHPIPPEYENAWMVQVLSPGQLGHVQGTVQCADALSDKKYWL